MEVLLLGYFALVQLRFPVAAAWVHQAAVAVVLVRLDSSDVDLTSGAIITALHQRGTVR